MEYQDINAAAITQWIAEGWEWGRPVDHETYERALAGEWDIVLTPTRPVPHEWFPDLRGRHVLGLAAGGGQQMPILTALGARCTVLDYTPAQLDADRMVAEREHYIIDVVRADMSKPLPFDDGSFDLIVHPVANCYIEEVLPLWRECFRVLRPGGRLMAGLDNGFNYAFGDDEERVVNHLPFNPLKNPDQMAQLDRVNDGVQFSHTLDEQIRGQIQAGFRIVDLYEDTNGAGRLHELGIPTFWATLAQKPE
ncbi:class I SAM-dependent methyltransferase [Bifidobacterium phasiani]|uniref:Class I SAM-dependent methyltransferase n=1 Tax=Bifidobacterium phasiani TaxID=2834431 RepID=A0ABS6W7N5_9BIFI|nr:class I SAM-dependent methyltransferase [Bifidobacterium phasiani]MBW3082513.1 class I SAM-dependent methyltransferase [Bifidobacterium phasiani]